MSVVAKEKQKEEKRLAKGPAFASKKKKKKKSGDAKPTKGGHFLSNPAGKRERGEGEGKGSTPLL